MIPNDSLWLLEAQPKVAFIEFLTIYSISMEATPQGWIAKSQDLAKQSPGFSFHLVVMGHNF